MPKQYPTKPRPIGDGITMVRVQAESVRATHDGLWQAFFRGYLNSPDVMPVPFLHDIYPWFGHTSRLRDFLHMGPARADAAATAHFTAAAQSVLTGMPVVPKTNWGYAGYEESVTALYPAFHSHDLHKLIRLLDLLTHVHARLGKQEWRTDVLGVVQQPRYREALYHLGVYARSMQTNKSS